MSGGGPDRPLLIERWVGILPLPFYAAVIGWAVILVVAFPFFAAFADTGSFNAASQYVLDNNCAVGCNFTQQVGSFVSNFLFFVVPTVMARRMRLKVVQDEPVLSALAPGGAEAYSKAFRSASRFLPQVLLAVVVFVAFAIPGASTQSSPAPGPISSLTFVSYFYSLLAFGSFIWIYFVALRGVRDFGGKLLTLKSPVEDPFQGAGPIGSFSLSIALSYFSVAAVGLVSAVLSESFDPSSTLIISTMSVFGLGMFFLPLGNLHGRMRENKSRVLSVLRKDLTTLAGSSRGDGTFDQGEASRRVERLLGAEVLYNQAVGAHTWPFDTGTLGRLTAVVLSIIAILMSKILSSALGI